MGIASSQDFPLDCFDGGATRLIINYNLSKGKGRLYSVTTVTVFSNYVPQREYRNLPQTCRLLFPVRF
jgi:hypothetical protein